MRLANSWIILACIAATGNLAVTDSALAQGASNRRAVEQPNVGQQEAVTESRKNDDVAAERPSTPTDGAAPGAGQDRSNVGPIRWMAPESLSNKAVTAPDDGAATQDADSGKPQTRDRDDEGRTDKSDAVRARRIRGEPCPVPPVQGNPDPAGVAGGAISTPGSTAATQGCGNP